MKKTFVVFITLFVLASVQNFWVSELIAAKHKKVNIEKIFDWVKNELNWEGPTPKVEFLDTIDFCIERFEDYIWIRMNVYEDFSEMKQVEKEGIMKMCYFASMGFYSIPKDMVYIRNYFAGIRPDTKCELETTIVHEMVHYIQDKKNLVSLNKETWSTNLEKLEEQAYK